MLASEDDYNYSQYGKNKNGPNHQPDSVWYDMAFIDHPAEHEHRSTAEANHETTTISPSYQMNANDIIHLRK